MAQSRALPQRDRTDASPQYAAPAAGIIETIRSRRSALSVSELAGILGIGARTIYTKVKAGKLPALNVFGAIRLDPTEIADWLEAHRA